MENMRTFRHCGGCKHLDTNSVFEQCKFLHSEAVPQWVRHLSLPKMRVDMQEAIICPAFDGEDYKPVTAQPKFYGEQPTETF